jgi:chromosome segregation ATPase
MASKLCLLACLAKGDSLRAPCSQFAKKVRREIFALLPDARGLSTPFLQVNVYQKTIQTLMGKLNTVGTEHDAELHQRDMLAEDAERDRSESIQEREQLAERLQETQERLSDVEEELVYRDAKLRETEAKHANVLMLQVSDWRVPRFPTLKLKHM